MRDITVVALALSGAVLLTTGFAFGLVVFVETRQLLRASRRLAGGVRAFDAMTYGLYYILRNRWPIPETAHLVPPIRRHLITWWVASVVGFGLITVAVVRSA